MKKLFILVLSVIFVLSVALVGCEKKKVEAPKPAAPSVVTPPPAPATPAPAPAPVAPAAPAPAPAKPAKK